MTDQRPLEKYYRQPAIYIKLPSKGKYYSGDVFTPSETGEIPVLPMNAKDELAFKTPDAMMSGQATVDVIKSCIPNFKDPWQVVNYDTDTLLLAIRIATYGETMDVNFTVPNTTEEGQHTINLPAMLESIQAQTIEHSFKIRDLTFHIAPLSYKDMNLVSLETFQQQRIYASLRDSRIDDEQKVKTFDDSFKKMTDLTNEILLKNIKHIETGNESVTDPSQIADFLKNVDAKLMAEIQKKLQAFRMQGSVPPVKLQATEEQIKKGAPASYEVPVTFDTANFFV